jgi:manganese transport protein
MTLAAEVGGIALALQLLSGLSYFALIGVAAVGLVLVLWLMPFDWIERVFGYGGLALVVFVVAAIKLHPDWGHVGHGLVPGIHTGNATLYAYFAVGLVGAAMVPYEVYFYSSGAVEERWTAKDLGVNRSNAIIGYSIGGLLSFALMISAGALLLPQGIDAELLGTVALVAEAPLGTIGLVLALVGILFAVTGASIDTAFSGGYNVAQFFGWEWGKYRKPTGAPRFTLAWLAMVALASAIVVTGVDPIAVTEISVIFAAVALPLTYLPILLVANDRAYMGDHANGLLANVFGVVYLVVVLVVAVAAVPLMLMTNMGQG